MLQKEWILSILYRASSNLCSISWVFLGEAKRKALFFEHPYFVATMIYFGEYLCLLLSLTSNRKGIPLTKLPIKPIKYWIPSLLSIGSLYLQILCANWRLEAAVNPYIGVSLVLITMLTSIRTRNQIPRHHYLGIILVIAGDMAFLSYTIMKGNFNLFGCVATIASQAVIGLQVFIEEHYYKEYEVSAMQCAGYEGMMCTSASVIIMPILQCCYASGKPLEDSIDAINNVMNSKYTILLIATIILSSCAAAMSGQAITRELSGMHKVILIQLKYATFNILLICLLRSSILLLPTVGYILIILAALIFHEVIVIRFCNFDYFTQSKLKDREYYSKEKSDED